jgi:hypothetical protein
MALTKWDEYLIHQAYDTIDAGVDVDRLYVACHDTAGELHLAVGIGAYTKANVMDGFVIVRHKSNQYNMRLSRQLNNDRGDTRIGPLTVTVIEPLKRWGVLLDRNNCGVSCSVEFEGRIAPYLSKSSVIPFVHYNQPGHCTGSVVVDGREISVAGFLGARDRSWRIHIGPQASDGRPWLGHFWMMAQFSDCCLSLHGVPVWDGSPPEFKAALLYDDGRIIPVNEVRHRVEFLPGVRAVSQVELLLKCADGKNRHVIARPKSPALYIGSGAGYEQQGQNKGLLNIEGERWDVSQPADVGSLHFGSTGMSEFVTDFQLDGAFGTGILEASYCPDKERAYRPTW